MASVTQAQALIAFIVPEEITLRTSHTGPPESVQRLYEEIIDPIKSWFGSFHHSKDSTAQRLFQDACNRINEINEQIRTLDYSWAIYGTTLRALVPAMDRAVALRSSSHPSRDRDYRCLRAAALNYFLQTRIPEALLSILGLEQEELRPPSMAGGPQAVSQGLTRSIWDPNSVGGQLGRRGLRGALEETRGQPPRGTQFASYRATRNLDLPGPSMSGIGGATTASGTRMIFGEVKDPIVGSPFSTPEHHKRIIDPQVQSGEMSSATSKTNNPFPPEVWGGVLKDLPSLTGRHVAQSFGFELSERHNRHSDIWSKIFKDKEKWTSIATKQGLQIVLIGDDLHGLFADSTQQAYLTLSTRDYSGDIKYDKAELLASLRPYHWNTDKEIAFDESNITLNIDEPLHCPEIATASLPRLFGLEQGRLRSASLFWKDTQYELRTIGPDDIVGIGERVSTLQDVSLICAVTLTHPGEEELSEGNQYLFKSPDCPPVKPIFSDDRLNISRWEPL